jgi:hypothetical protein
VADALGRAGVCADERGECQLFASGRPPFRALNRRYFRRRLRVKDIVSVYAESSARRAEFLTS